jgi:hypothetical protein
MIGLQNAQEAKRFEVQRCWTQTLDWLEIDCSDVRRVADGQEATGLTETRVLSVVQ